ncbi:hypothetical protein Cal6303_3927 [Calothrix sp. PCC 6303]|nr:hypothetical protein Cal6303_3927 [Calothrix sp. PCC 6303]
MRQLNSSEVKGWLTFLSFYLDMGKIDAFSGRL